MLGRIENATTIELVEELRTRSGVTAEYIAEDQDFEYRYSPDNTIFNDEGPIILIQIRGQDNAIADSLKKGWTLLETL